MGSSSWPQVIRKAVCAFKTEITTEALPWKKIKHTCQRQVNTFPHESYLTQAWRRSWLLPISLNKTENKSVCITCGLITFSTFSPWSQMTFRLMGNLGQLGVSEGWYSVNLAQLFERFCLFWSSLLFCVCFFFSLLCILIHLQNQLKHYICKRQKISDVSTCTSWVAFFFCMFHASSFKKLHFDISLMNSLGNNSCASRADNMVSFSAALQMCEIWQFQLY